MNKIMSGRMGTFVMNHLAYAMVLKTIGFEWWWILLVLSPLQILLDYYSLGVSRHDIKRQLEILKGTSDEQGSD